MLQKSSMQKTLELFFLYPLTEFYLLDISRKIKVAHTSVKNNLKELVREGLIEESIEKRGQRKFPAYRAAATKKFRQQKVIGNLVALLESGVVNVIEEKLQPRVIVVFGSFRRGEDVEESDVDLFVECEEETLDLALFERKLGRKVQLHFNR